MTAMLSSTALARQAMVFPSLDQRGNYLVEITEGMTVSEIVAATFPEFPDGRLAMVRVTIGEWVIEAGTWHRVRPRPGMTVVIRVVPQGSGLRSVLAVVVSIAAIALGQFYVGPLLAGALGIGQAAAAGLATAALGFVGNLLLNALIPVKPLDSNKDSPTYSVEGWKNVRNPDGVIPSLLGKHRVAPPHLASPFTQTIGNERWITGVMGLYGPCEIDDIKIGDTSIDQLQEDDYQIEIRYGYPDDAPLTLYPTQVVEDQVGIELEERDNDDVYVNGVKFFPVTRTTPPDAAEWSVDFAFPGGLSEVGDDGDTESQGVDLKIEKRLLGEADFTLVEEYTIRENKRKPFFRTYRRTPPVRGTYEIRITQTGGKDDNSSKQIQWVCIRAHRPEYPLNFGKPLTMICMKVRATKLTNGTLNELNAVFGRICKDWDADTGTWIDRVTSNPASIYRYALQGPENRPQDIKTDAEIDLPQLQDWHDYCALKGLTYDRVHDYDATFEEVLFDICRAGRATPQNVGTKAGVCIDRPQTLIRQHISPRNAWNMTWEMTPVTPPDAFRIKFRDRDYRYEEHERIVRRPGLVGDPQRIEEMSAPGETSAAQVWRTGTRRFLELEYRLETYSATQDVESLPCVRGSLVRYAPFRSQVAARVAAVEGMTDGWTVVLDDMVTMDDAGSYAVRFRLSDGGSALWSVQTVEGRGKSLALASLASGVAPEGAGSGYRPTDDDWLPERDDLALFGVTDGDSMEMIVKDVENGTNMTAVLTLTPHAPEIDGILDGLTPPPWDARVGDEVETDVVEPGTPRFTNVMSGEGARTPDDAPTDYPPIRFAIAATGAVPVVSYEVGHKLHTSGTWLGPVMVYAYIGSGEVGGYAAADVVDLRVRAVGMTGLTSAYSSTRTLTVGDDDAPQIAPPTEATANVVGSDVTFGWINGNDVRIEAAQVYRAAAGDAFDDADALGSPIFSGATEVRSITDTPGVGSWDYWVVNTGTGPTSNPAGPATAVVP